ncbi:MAG TPA: cytochrome b N-terminal domain-containing protein [Candidatus Nitrosotalea sp.]|nr:cytochrome b N-terminal domain-containing protein [Candidatus Nitrosotalea sp.]
MKALVNWLDNRTGIRGLIHEALFERVPGGARWRYVWGSTLTFCIAIQFITGVFLWMAYSPSSQTAWESVYYIQHEMTGGWFLRGLHHFTAQALNVLLVLHLMQVVIDGAYRAPREVNFWFGLGLLFLVLGLSLTGYLLPWDQKGYWATRVATNIAGITPMIGPQIQQLLIGGMEYGHHTLTRFFALHAGVLPGLLVTLIAGHVYLFRKHGLTAKQPLLRPDATFWPDQVLMDAVACLAVLAAVCALTLRSHGAELAAPADPSEAYSAARPEWYFLFLFQLLKHFPASKQFLGLNLEVWGALILPGMLTLVVFLMPLIGRRRIGHWFNLAVLWTLLAGIGLLTWQAVQEDRAKPEFLAALREGERNAERVKVLAQSPAGIPREGAVSLLRRDPLTQGPKLFVRNCAGCHRYGGQDAAGNIPKDVQSASDLKGFASREWLSGLLDPASIVTLHYFGGTKFKDGKMVRFVKKDIAGFNPEQKAQLQKVIIALSAEAGLKSQHSADQLDSGTIAEGRKLIVGDTMRCTECHRFHDAGDDPTGPELTGYGSRQWLIDFISNPAHTRFYGKRNDRMPVFDEDKVLDSKSIAVIADWLRGEWYEPEPLAGVTRSRP